MSIPISLRVDRPFQPAWRHHQLRRTTGLRGPKRSEHSHSAGAFRRSKKPPSPDAEGVQLVSSGLSMAASSRSPRLSLVMARNASPRPKTRSSSAGRSAATPCGRGTSGSPFDRPQVRHGPADSDDLPTTAKCQPVPIARLLSSRIWRDVLFRIELRAAQELLPDFFLVLAITPEPAMRKSDFAPHRRGDGLRRP